MKFIVDECCDTGLVASLRFDGHDVLYISEKKPGAPDEEILLDAYNEGRILLTEDKDFGELVYRLKKPSRGIVKPSSRAFCCNRYSEISFSTLTLLTSLIFSVGI